MSDSSRERNKKLSEDAQGRVDAIRGGKEEDEIIPDQRYYGDED